MDKSITVEKKEIPLKKPAFLRKLDKVQSIYNSWKITEENGSGELRNGNK